MWNALLESLPTIIGSVIVFGTVGAILYNGYRNHKRGKHACSCGGGLRQLRRVRAVPPGAGQKAVTARLHTTKREGEQHVFVGHEPALFVCD